MPGSAEPDDEGHVYSVRPEPPRFDEVIRRPALFSNESPFVPAGPVVRWFGARRLRALFRGGLVVVALAVAVLILR